MVRDMLPPSLAYPVPFHAPKPSAPRTNTAAYSDLMLLGWVDAEITTPSLSNAPVPLSLLAHLLQNSRNPVAVVIWMSLIALEKGRKRWV